MARRRSSAQLRNEVVSHLEDFPRQLLALESAMEEFGDDFDLKEFKRAFDDEADIKAYNRVQAVERAFSRVQNYVSQLSLDGAALAGLKLPRTHESKTGQAFEALKEAGVIDATLCKRLKRAQKARSTVEHSYVKVKAGQLHEAVGLVAESARAFIGPYGKWIAEHL